jgi:hypothetical protein
MVQPAQPWSEITVAFAFGLRSTGRLSGVSFPNEGIAR